MVAISTTTEAHWGRLFYYTEMRITVRWNGQPAPPPKHQQVSLRQLIVNWQKRKGKRKGSCHFLGFLDWIQNLRGTKTHQGKWKTSVTHRHISLTCPWILFGSLSCTAAIRSVLIMCFTLGFFILYSPCTEKVVFYLLTCCLNCPVQCVQPPSLPHCDYFVCIVKGHVLLFYSTHTLWFPGLWVINVLILWKGKEQMWLLNISSTLLN